MKKIVLFVVAVINLVGCCKQGNEIGKEIIPEENKVYFNTSSKTVEYINQDDISEFLVFSGIIYSNYQEEIGADACDYRTYEEGEEYFNLNNYKIVLKITPFNFIVQTLQDEIVKEGFNLSYGGQSLDNLLQNISINGFIFNDILILENHNEINPIIEKILYSKTHGIEFILFEDGTWYKRVE